MLLFFFAVLDSRVKSQYFDYFQILNTSAEPGTCKN